jgi:protease-4
LKDRAILWVFVAFVLGFALPVCSCVGMGFIALYSMGRFFGEPASAATGAGPAVAVLWFDGTITSGPEEEIYTVQGITPDRSAKLLAQAAAPDVKAVVVRVNSPGGSVVASDEIYHMLLNFDKPVVVWMADMAASGGYYISCAGDYVFAHPGTLAGSIGVISQFITAEELMDKIGVDAVVITSGPRKDIGSPFRDMTDEEKALWEEIIDETYEGFVEVVAEARGLPLEDVRELADGSLYTGRQALELGLVDEVGTLEDAIAKAAEMGSIEGEPRVIELKPAISFFDLMYGFQAGSTMPRLEEVLDWVAVPSLQFRLVGP